MRNVKLDKAVTQMAVMTNDTKFCSEKVKKLLEGKRQRWDYNIKEVVREVE
jgi:predicted nucleic acid-binding Zn ribbon protein